jgi:hypothetical protein
MQPFHFSLLKIYIVLLVCKKKIYFMIIHIARILAKNNRIAYLLLRKPEAYRYIWFLEDTTGNESETAIWAGSPYDALMAAYKNWSLQEIRSVHCGFRYTLPERDEVGSNALFYQMVASYESMSGVYFDEELASNCIVHNASLEAKQLWKRLANK